MTHILNHVLELLPVGLRLALPELWSSKSIGPKPGKSAAAARVPDAIELGDDRYDQLFEGHRPRATNQLAAVRSPFGRPRASGWTERPDRSSPSARDGQDVRVLSPEFHRALGRWQAAMAQCTGSHGVGR